MDLLKTSLLRFLLFWAALTVLIASGPLLDAAHLELCYWHWDTTTPCSIWSLATRDESYAQ
jgi:hypothetical protein